VTYALTIGNTLVTVCEQGTIVAWSLPDGAVVRRLHSGFAPSAICHPATYLNKVLLGSPDGRLQLWNLRSGERVHECAQFGKKAMYSSAVLALEQSPALDVVGSSCTT
jgi:U3 small nucleolar RNA-associated protein 21